MNTNVTEQTSPLILVVDDDKATRLMLCRAMEQAGYRVIEAADGEACLAAYKDHRPQMILLDAEMPVMDGFTCCRQLHTLPGGDRTPVLMVTILGDPESVDRAFEAGVTDYVTKPIHWAVLRQRVRRLLQTSQAMAALQAEITQHQQTTAKLKALTAELERSNGELQSFAYTASHDLQEPLRKIHMLGERLRSTCVESLSDQGQDYLERMQQAAKRMNSLLQDLLALSRITTQGQPFMPVNLTHVVQGVVSDLEARIEESGGHVKASNLPILDADPTQMRQLLQNLISNGLKFHKAGEVPIVEVQGQILHQEQSSSGGASTSELCQIRVIDNGIGFDEKYLERIFAIFQRLHGRNEYEGTGIGLAICRKITDRHGGTITATSTPGQGATFIVTLPCKQPGNPEHNQS